MRNFACFNELSISPLCVSEADVDQRVKSFLRMIKDVREHAQIKRVRHEGDMTTIMLTNSLSLQDYLNTHTTDSAVRALLGLFIHPQIDMDDEISSLNYFDTKTCVKLKSGALIPADGFNAAYCQNTLCVGFESCPTWQNDFFDINVTSNGKSNEVSWVCISSPVAFGNEEGNSNRGSAVEKWLQERNVELVETTLLPEQKQKDVDGDHGQQELKEHARSLNNNPYVEGVLTSLPFKPRSQDYILKVTDDGLIDIVLWWEDAGYSMRVKTTGRNIAETREIAKILKEKYGRRK